MLGEKLNSNINGVLNRAHALVSKGAGVMGIADSYTNSKFQVPNYKFGYADFRFAPIQVPNYKLQIPGFKFGYADFASRNFALLRFRFAPIQIPILNKSRLVERKAITTNLNTLSTPNSRLRTSVSQLRTPVFGLRTSVSGLRSSDFGLRTSVFGLPTSNYSNNFHPQFYNLNFQNLKFFSVSKVEQKWTSTFSSINFIYLHTGTSPPRCRAPVETP
jgi:hypothetical protein